MNKKQFLGFIPLLLTLGIGIFCLISLPYRVTSNISFSGESVYMSKYIAVFVPFIISSLSSLVYVLRSKNEENSSSKKFLALSFLGTALLLWLIIKNI